MTTLFEYTDVEPPKVSKDRAIEIVTKDGVRMVGFVGRDLNRGSPEIGYVSKRNRETHYFRKGEGYPIAEEVLLRLESFSVTEILIVEENTGTVYEFSPTDYYYGQNIQEDGFELQKCVPLDSAIRTWENHAHNIM